MGTATLTITGKRNYGETKTVTLTVKARDAQLVGAIAWRRNLGTGTFFAQVKLARTNDTDEAVVEMEYLFADRTAPVVQLWNTRAHGPQATTRTIDGTSYRSVTLDPTAISAAARDAEVVYGVSDVTATSGNVPADERLIEIYSRDFKAPADIDGYVGYLRYVSAGVTNFIGLTAGELASKRLAKLARPLAAPLSVSALETMLATGLDPASTPGCRLTAFGVANGILSGRISVEDATGRVGTIGSNVTLTLCGATTPSDAYRDLGTMAVDSEGRFEAKLPKGASFFRVRINVETTELK